MNNDFLTDFFKSPWGADFQFPLRNLQVNKIPGGADLTFLANFSEKIPGGAEPKIAIFELKFRGGGLLRYTAVTCAQSARTRFLC